MTTDQLAAYYAGLLINQYNGLPKASAHISALVRPFLMDMIVGTIGAAYNPSTAVGVQLDLIGKIVGVRGLSGIPDGTGRTQRTFTGVVQLNDTDFLQLILMKIACNYSGTSLNDLQNLIATFFAGTVRVYDNRNMNISYVFDSLFGNQQLAQIIVQNNYLPKPMGVQLASVKYFTGVFGILWFGFRRASFTPTGIVGFKRYGADTKGRFLRYGDFVGQGSGG